MNQVPKLVAVIAMAASLVLAASTDANAYDYCRMDVTGHMTSCSFDTMEQCKAMSSGIGGDCFRYPFLKDHNNAYAHGPAHLASRQGRAAGKHHH